MKKELCVIIPLIIIDQLIKLWAMTITDPISVIGNFLQFNYVKNFGVAWSMFNNQMLLIILFSLAAVGYLYYLLVSFRNEVVIHFGLMMVVAGALGNMIDRIFRGFVVDYVDTVIFGYDFPVFNLADTLLVCGAILIFIEAYRKEGHEKRINSK